MSAQAPDFKPDELLPGTKYRVVRQIGAGGMGVVYEVVKPPEIRGVLKLMSTELVEHEEFRVRFLDEVRVLAQLDHPNIVKVSDYDTLADGTPFYVMELLHGRTVRDVLATMGTIPAKVAFEITRQLCEALHAAHTHHITVVHRDIKPENIFLHAPRHGEPVVKLIDFGVVALADRKHDGTFVGTWKYAAPEQIRGEQAVPATDLYAVGLVLYEMLCGMGPFEQYETGPLISRAHMFEAPPPVSKFAPWVPASIVSLIDSTLAKDARYRPRDAYAFAERLYELEWANDGQNLPERTAEGPLRRILSDHRALGPAKPAAGAAPPRNQDVPLVVGDPRAPRHEGPTLRGVGDGTAPPEVTSPGEDALLAGLGARLDSKPLSKKARDSGPGNPPVDVTPRYPNVVHRIAPPAGALGDAATLDAPASQPKQRITGATQESLGIGTTRRLSTPAAAKPGQVDTDTFASQESDARRPVRGKGGRALVVIALFGVATLVAAALLIVARLKRPELPAVAATAEARSTVLAPPPPPPVATELPPPAPTAAPSVAPATSDRAQDRSAPAARGGRSRPSKSEPITTSAPERTIEPSPAAVTSPQPAAPKPTAAPKQDDSLIRSF